MPLSTCITVPVTWGNPGQERVTFPKVLVDGGAGGGRSHPDDQQLCLRLVKRQRTQPHLPAAAAARAASAPNAVFPEQTRLVGSSSSSGARSLQ